MGGLKIEGPMYYDCSKYHKGPQLLGPIYTMRTVCITTVSTVVISFINLYSSTYFRMSLAYRYIQYIASCDLRPLHFKTSLYLKTSSQLYYSYFQHK